MKANIIKPVTRLKTYDFNIDKVVTETHEEWNSFSTSPKEGENFSQYSFQQERYVKDPQNS